MSVPSGYASPNPALNISLAKAALVATALGAFGVTVTKTVIQTGGGTGVPSSDGAYVTPAEAEASGATVSDPLYVQFALTSSEGEVQGYQEAATIYNVLLQGAKPGAALAALTALFTALYPYGNASSLAINAFLGNPAVLAAAQSELAALAAS